MNPKTQKSFDGEGAREIPAQEQGVVAGEVLAVLSAEQVYAQRLAEKPLSEDVPGPIFVP
ncbi:MAG: hypothetical protein Fur0016_22660 [Anaerolineales bacterium]